MIKKEILNIFHLLKRLSKDEELFLVGGFLRDYILKRNTLDFDFCIKKNVQYFCKIVSRELGAKCFVLDKDTETYRVILKIDEKQINLDFSQIKGKTIYDDLALRDYTINAIALDITKIDKIKKNIIDPFNGNGDIEKRIIKSISKQNLIDDPLRLLRAFRFKAELKFNIEAKTLAFIKSLSKRIHKSSSERIKDELYKILSVTDSTEIFKQLDKTNLLGEIFPEVTACRNLAKVYYKKEGVLTHLLQTLNRMEYIKENTKSLFGNLSPFIRKYIFETISGGYPRFTTLKLASLLHDVGKAPTAKMREGRLRFFYHEEEGDKMVKNIADRLRLSSNEKDIVSAMTLGHMRPGNLAYQKEITDRAKYRYFRDYGNKSISLLLISLADRFTYLTDRQIKSKKDKHHKAILNLINHYYFAREKVNPPKIINGHQIMKELNIPSSPLVGKILVEINENIVEGNIKTKEDAVRLAKTILDLKQTEGKEIN
ncbi:MAG: HD domain-containing protein [bacterium]